MMRAIKAELIKTFGYATFWVLLSLHAILFLLVLMVANNATLNLNGVETNILLSKPYTWGTVAWLASWFNLILALLSIILSGNDFLFGTFRRVLLDGFSRNQLFKAKLSLLLLIALYVVVIVTLIALFATPVLNSWQNLFTGYGYILVLFIQMLGYFSIALLIIMLTRNIALTIVMYLLYFALIEPIIRLFLPDSVAMLMPVKIISNLTPMPDFLGIMARQFNVNEQLDPGTLNTLDAINSGTSLTQNIVIAVIYIALFTVLSYFIFRRKDF